MPIINTIIAGGGTTPTGTKSITANGVYDVTDFASADVQVPTTAPAHYIEKTVDANGKLVNSTNIINLSGVTEVGLEVLYSAYRGVAFPANTSADLSSLTTISENYACYQMFRDCTGLTSANLSALTMMNAEGACGFMFYGCTGLTSVDLSSLTTLGSRSSNACNSMFYGCTGLTSVDLSSLTAIMNNACANMFQGCTGLTSVDLSGLTAIKGYATCANMFRGCTSLATVYIGGTTAIDFGTSTNQFQSMFYGCTQNIDVYAPAASQAKIESFSGYPNFVGTGTVTWHWRS